MLTCLTDASSAEHCKTPDVYPQIVWSRNAKTLRVLEALSEGLLESIQPMRSIPHRVWVNRTEYELFLKPLAERIGFEVKTRAALPPLNAAKQAMLSAFS